ncbi:acylphosphatase [Paenarthrobacter sp. NPDC089989]|uniref:acylphosphatase n=1 Tax=unclassified Paenarthrobacter TaxID=2634190 RepID=UPI003803E3C4
MQTEDMRLTARISGVVQGVGFRYWTARKADELLLKGTVRNRSDGSVEIVAEGPREEMDQFVQWLHSSRGPGRVDKVDIEVSDWTGEFYGFKILG